jgi:hypothetical protein
MTPSENSPQFYCQGGHLCWPLFAIFWNEHCILNFIVANKIFIFLSLENKYIT